jgi:hypothetical protein
MPNKTCAIAATIAVMIASSSSAEAGCHHPNTGWKFGKSVSALWSTDEDGVCTSRSLHPENIEKIEITAKPKHGMAGSSGPDSVAYKPDHNFRGRDTFSYAVISNSNAGKGAGRIARVTVFVDVR